MVSDEQLLDDLQQFAEEVEGTPTSTEMRDSGPWTVSTYSRHFGSWSNSLRAAGLRVNYGATKEELITDLRSFAEEIGKTPCHRELQENGPWDTKTYVNHFGSLNNAIKSANLEVNRENVTKKQLIDDLKEFAEKLEKTPTKYEMDEFGPWSGGTYESNFESWNCALKTANLDTNNEINIDNDRLIEDLQEFAKELGKTPFGREMSDNGPWSVGTYRVRFGSWNNAIRKAGLEINLLGPEERAGTSEEYMGEDYKQKRSETLERDKYICRVCEATDDLHCHHIKPRRMFDNVNDSNTLDNLITLCSSCHSTFEGKWKDATPDEFAERAKETKTTTPHP